MLRLASFDVVFQEIPGEVTLALNLSGCPNRCAGCHSPHLWEEVGERTGHGELPQDWSPSFIRKACEGSLKRLGRDWIDLYQIHNPRMETVRSQKLLETLQGLKKEGKIREN